MAPLSVLLCTYVGISFHTQDLLQQRGDAGENTDAGAETQQQDDVGFVPQ